MSGLALDIEDPDNELDKLIASKPELLDKYGLWLEHPDSTPKWTHLDKGRSMVIAVMAWLYQNG